LPRIRLRQARAFARLVALQLVDMAHDRRMQLARGRARRKGEIDVAMAKDPAALDHGDEIGKGGERPAERPQQNDQQRECATPRQLGCDARGRSGSSR
jgi:hypothetical protein